MHVFFLIIRPLQGIQKRKRSDRNGTDCRREKRTTVIETAKGRKTREILSENEEQGLEHPETDKSEESEEETEFYGGNEAFPVYSKSKKVLSPEEVLTLLTERGAFPLSKVCHRQPLHVEHQRTFIVDMSHLRSPKDIKCDDMGSWRNLSANKYSYNVTWNEEGQIEMIRTVEAGSNNVVTIKRKYFSLNHDVHNDVRKRIDTIFGK